MFLVNAMSHQQMWEESCKKILYPNHTPIRAILLFLLCFCKLNGDSGDNALYIEGNFEVNRKHCKTAVAG